MKQTSFYFNVLEKRLEEIISTGPRQIAIVTDKNVSALYAKNIFLHVLKCQLQTLIIEIEPGEASKTRETKSYIEDILMTHHCNRNLLLIAIGGGVITDITGFVASTYNRGVDLIYIPTTLLCMVDAAIGGKTAVNTPFGKNLIGSFYTPNIVFIETKFLSSLEHKHYVSAFSEIIKHALISDKEYFKFLKEKKRLLLNKDKKALHYVIQKSIDIKKHVVNKDIKEKGLRAILNFGHTIGHAIEKASNFSLTHGEAVAIGICIESLISLKMGSLPLKDFKEIMTTLKSFSLPIDLPCQLNKSTIFELLKLDKKNKEQSPHFVIIQSIGNVLIHDNNYSYTIPSEILHPCLELLCNQTIEEYLINEFAL